MADIVQSVVISGVFVPAPCVPACPCLCRGGRFSVFLPLSPCTMCSCLSMSLLGWSFLCVSASFSLHHDLVPVCPCLSWRGLFSVFLPFCAFTMCSWSVLSMSLPGWSCLCTSASLSLHHVFLFDRASPGVVSVSLPLCLCTTCSCLTVPLPGWSLSLHLSVSAPRVPV